MLPSPIKPIFMWLPRCCCQAVGRAVHAVRSGGAAPTPLCGSPARGGKGGSRGRALHAVRSEGAAPTHRCGALPAGGRAVPVGVLCTPFAAGRCSYTPLWEPCLWAKGCSLGVLCTPFAARALLLQTFVGAPPSGRMARSARPLSCA